MKRPSAVIIPQFSKENAFTKGRQQQCHTNEGTGLYFGSDWRNLKKNILKNVLRLVMRILWGKVVNDTKVLGNYLDLRLVPD